MKLIVLSLLVGAYVHQTHAKILGSFPGMGSFFVYSVYGLRTHPIFVWLADSPNVIQDNVVVNGQSQLVNTTATADSCPPLNLNNIQGDILYVPPAPDIGRRVKAQLPSYRVGMKKLQENFVFFGKSI